MNFYIKFMVILNCTNQEEKVIYVVQSQNNAYIRKVTIFLLTYHKSYIKMSLFLVTPKWKLQNWQLMSLITLGIYTFFNLYLIQKLLGQICSLWKKVSNNVYVFESKSIWAICQAIKWLIFIFILAIWFLTFQMAINYGYGFCFVNATPF